MNSQLQPTFSTSTYKMLPKIAAMAFFMQSLDNSILNTALPTMAVYLNESPLNMQSAIICYALALALFIPVSGFLADRFGTRSIFVLAVFLFTLGSLCCASSTDLIMLDISRIIQGIGGSMMMPVSRLAMIKTFKRSELLSAINASVIPGLVGSVLGPFVGGYLVEYASWHWIFLINLPIGLLGIYAAIRFMPNIKGQIKPFDGIGFSLIALGLILVTLGIDLSQEQLAHWLLMLFILAGVLSLLLYVPYARHCRFPIFPLSLFTIPTFRVGIVGNLISRLGISSISLLAPLMLQLAFHYSAAQAGMMMMLVAIGSMSMKTLVKKILRRVGYRRVLISNTLIAGLLISSIALLSHTTPIVVLCLILLCVGFVNSLQFTAMNTITLADLEGEQTTSGNSLMAVNQQLAISFGIALGAALVRVFSQSPEVIEHDILNAFRYSFLILGIITIISSITFTRLSPTAGQNMTTHKIPNVGTANEGK